MRLNILKDGKRANQAVVRKTKYSPSIRFVISGGVMFLAIHYFHIQGEKLL